MQEDLAMPLVEEEIDGLSGQLFPFYDMDTHMLYLAGKVSSHFVIFSHAFQSTDHYPHILLT